MISEVVMPQMGADMEEGTIVRWLKSEGDEVERGEIIAEIETDKANVEIEAFESGVFRRTLAEEGDTVEVGTVIAIIASADEDVSDYKPSGEGKPPATGEGKPAATGEGTPPAQAAEPPAAPAAPSSRAKASPVARKLAEERGIDLASITGTGPDGRIVKRDIEAAGSAPAAPERSAAERAPATATGDKPVASKMRQAIARRMSQSKREAPHYYITIDVDMTNAEETRHQVNDARVAGLRLITNDLVVKATAMALERHPEFNAWYVDGEVQRHDAINISIAIALDEGLIAPAILDCANKRLADISAATRSLAERTKDGALTADEYTAGTFTISNLGLFDIEMLIAIIQPPQTAILGVGAVREVPVVRDGHVEPGKLMKIALSADHRVTDGAQGARFVKEIRRLLEEPAPLLL